MTKPTHVLKLDGYKFARREWLRREQAPIEPPVPGSIPRDVGTIVTLAGCVWAWLVIIHAVWKMVTN